MQQTRTKENKNTTDVGRWYLGIVQKIYIWPYWQIPYAQTESILENEVHKFLGDFEIQADPLILARKPDLVIINKKREPTQ